MMLNLTETLSSTYLHIKNDQLIRNEDKKPRN